ncbi:MAG: M6 family metalloprotease domain-containing protein, partial [Draconibacterium sp.]
QPDGSKLTIMLKGDEFFHWTESEDGLIIMRNANDIFEYAKVDASGEIVLSGIKVHDISTRTASEVEFLKTIGKKTALDKLINRRTEAVKEKSDEIPIQSTGMATGTKKILCILIGFTDLPFSKPQAEFNSLMNQTGYNDGTARGSVKDYYLENSYGKLNLEITVAGPYMADHNMAYYGTNVLDDNGNRLSDIRSKDLVEEAVRKANPDVNYAEYDNDRDGYVDGVHVIYAGYAESVGGPADAIWPHKSSISKIKLDNKWISTYSCSSELRRFFGTTICGIGTICHELGHVLGAPDFYDINRGRVSDGDFEGTGRWDLMGGGNHNGGGDYPAHINPYTKIHTFGWATAKNLPANNSLVALYPANANDNSFYKIPTPTSGEYFLIENRQQLGFDAFLPGHGMLVWHVHKDIESDRYAINTTHPQRLYPLCASATQNPTSDPVSYGNINSGGCPFPGSTNQCFLNFTTTPSLRSWTGASIEKDIQFITESGNNITFVVNPQISGPRTVCYEATYTIKNFDQLPEGATVQWSAGNNILTLVSGQGTEACVFRKNERGISLIQAEISLNSQVISTLSFLVSTEIRVSIAGDTDMLGCNKTRTWQCSMNFSFLDIEVPVRINWTLEGDGQRYYGSGPAFSIGTSCRPIPSINASRQPIDTPHAIYTLRLELTLPDGTIYSAPDERFEIFGYIEVFGLPLDKILSIAPNPSTGETTISIQQESEEGVSLKSAFSETTFDETAQWDLEVYDRMQNLKLKKQKLKGSSATINTQSWRGGVYMLRINYKGEILTGKLVVKE